MPADNSGTTVEQLRQEVSDDILDEAAAIDGLSVDAILEDITEKRADYSLATQARFAAAELERQVESAGDETLKGILMGSRDRYDKNWPRRYSLLRKNGDHVELSSWDSALPGPNGPEVDLKPGTMVEIGASFDEEYEEYQAQRVEAMTELDAADLAEKLTSVARSPGDLSRTDEYEIVAVAGELQWVNPQTLFADGEPQGPGQIQMEDWREPPTLQPHFEAVLDLSGGTRVRVHFERQNAGSPYLALPEIDQLLDDALEEGPPPKQADFLQAALSGTEVVAVGNVNSVDQSRDDDGEKRMYVDIAATAMVAVDAPAGATGESETETAETEDPDAESEGDESTEMEELVSSIETAAELQGVDPEELTVADVGDMAPAIADEHPEEVIEHALRAIRGEVDPSTGTAEDTDADPEDPVALLEAAREDGTINCPAADCLAQEGDARDMVTHLVTDHGVDADGVAEWAGDRV